MALNGYYSTAGSTCPPRDRQTGLEDLKNLKKSSAKTQIQIKAFFSAVSCPQILILTGDQMQTVLRLAVQLKGCKPPDISEKSLNINILQLQKGIEKLSGYLRAGEQDRVLSGQQCASLQQCAPFLLTPAGRAKMSWHKHGGNAGSRRTVRYQISRKRSSVGEANLSVETYWVWKKRREESEKLPGDGQSRSLCSACSQ